MNPEIIKIIENNPIAVATVDSNNKPNVIAVAYVKVVDDKIVITDNFMKSTVKNLEGNNSICLAVWNSEWNGYKISGTAEYHTAGKWREFVQELPENKGFAAKGAVVVNIEEIKELG